MAGARRASRERGKSDSIDAFSVARAALREGIESLPGAHLDGAALDIRLVDHREDLIAARTSDQQRLRWHLHDLWPELGIPAGALDTNKWLGTVSRRLARATDHTRAGRPRARAPDHSAHQPDPRTRDRAHRARRELRATTASRARLWAADRSEAHRRDRRRRPLRDRRKARTHRRRRADPRLLGQHQPPSPRPRRQPPAQLRPHRLAVNKGTWDPDAAAYLARKQAEGKSRRETLRCLKRHLARRVWQLLRTPSDQDKRSNNDTTINNTQPPITGNAPYFMPCAR